MKFLWQRLFHLRSVVRRFYYSNCVLGHWYPFSGGLLAVFGSTCPMRQPDVSPLLKTFNLAQWLTKSASASNILLEFPSHFYPCALGKRLTYSGLIFAWILESSYPPNA